MQPDEIERIEGLGDNCELGFVLKALGHTSGSLFRWASMKPTQLLAMLRADFAGLYEFENLVPLRLAMVLDERFGIGWHSEIVSKIVEGRLVFRDDLPARRAIHRRERRKFAYLVAKFQARLREGGLLLVIKANEGIAPEVLSGIRVELARMAGHDDFLVMEVVAGGETGTVEAVEPRLLRGHVSRFASYDRADDSDRAAWEDILTQALERRPCPDWPRRVGAASAAIEDRSLAMRFPSGDGESSGADATAAILVNGNEWCRRVDGANFRLHGFDPDRPATMLRWMSQPLAAPHFLTGMVRAAVPDAVPVALILRARNADATDLRERRFVVSPERPLALELPVDADLGDGVVMEIEVAAIRPLKPGERAVVDVSPLVLHPAA